MAKKLKNFRLSEETLKMLDSITEELGFQNRTEALESIVQSFPELLKKLQEQEKKINQLEKEIKELKRPWWKRILG